MADSLSPVAIGFFVLIVLWLTGITYFLYKIISHYNSLIQRTDKKGLQNIVDTVIHEAKTSLEKVQHLTDRITKEERKGEGTIQKVSLIRFNPFSNTGGEQSFIAALLDQHDSGILFTSLQTRNGTRWYAKRVKKGKGVDFDLSKEEEEAIKKAQVLL